MSKIQLPLLREYKNNMFFLLAGPCVVEGEEITHQIARELKGICDKLQIPFVFKASYRKANRSKASSFTGIGDREGLQILKDIRNELFDSEHKIITTVHDEVPSFFGENSEIDNCLLADGCAIDGSIRNSVVFRNVKVGKGAKIKNCILMQDCEIGADADLSYCIIDKLSNVSAGTHLRGANDYPIILPVGYKV